MKSKPYQGIRAVIAEPRSSLRKEYIDVLKDLGCNDIIETGNIRDVHAAFAKGGVDVLIGDTTLPEGDLTEIVHQVRHGVIGDNPFIIAMILVSMSDKECVERVINSGADDILLKPMDAAQLRKRLVMFTFGRKRFVVTSDYIGPDREGGHRKGGMKVPLIKAPNPLQVRLTGEIGSGAMQKAVARTLIEVNAQKVERHAYSVHWLMERLLEVQNGDIDSSDLDMEKEFNRLNEMASDIASRLTGTGYHHAAEMCLTLERMTSILSNEPDMAGEEELSLLGKLTSVIKRKCNGNAPDEAMPFANALT